MYRVKKFEIRATEIADYLNEQLVGNEFIITSPHSIRTYKSSERSLMEVKRSGSQILIISDQPVPVDLCTGYIISQNPDLDLAYILREFFSTAPINQIHPSAIISAEAQIGRNVMIGAHTIIGPDVTIGDNTKIYHNVVINGLVNIGKFCVIKDGAVIGSEGWGFIDDEDGIPFHPPQLGLISIEDRVWIGSNSTIEHGMIEETVIHSDVKIDDLVHVGAGSHIGRKSKLTAGVVVASHVTIGENVYIAPNAVIREELNIANDIVVGMGAVVIGNLTAGNIYVGNPARLIKKK
jgi:UDP-3-O-[3-hydroxymyristoyl] glucosamine N-acyltransferase